MLKRTLVSMLTFTAVSIPGAVAQPAPFLAEPWICIRVAYERDAVIFSFFEESEPYEWVPTAVHVLAVKPDSPHEPAVWGVRAQGSDLSGRIRYGHVPKGFIQHAGATGPAPALLTGSTYLVTAIGPAGMTMVTFSPGKSRAGECLPRNDSRQTTEGS
jgi:hypothetical protein